MEEVFGLYHQLQLSAMDFHDPAASAAGLGLEGLMRVARAPGYVPSSCSASAAPAVSEASVAVESRGYAAAGTMVGGAGGEGQPAAGDEAVSGTSIAIKAKIASHPLYPRLLEAYIDCHKVGAPPEVASLLDEVLRENGGANKRNLASATSFPGDDPELDHFMATYCDMLVKYRSDIARPLDEAATFLSGMEVQLSNLCSRGSCSVSDEAARYSEEEFSGGDIEMDIRDSHMQTEDKELKERLLRKYSGYLGSLKQEFSKKKKKGKLPKTSRQTLLDWWTAHYKWPYPTEGDKIALAEATGLNPKQINNWFINQRKRHWKTTENMPFALMEGLPAPFYLND